MLIRSGTFRGRVHSVSNQLLLLQVRTYFIIALPFYFILTYNNLQMRISPLSSIKSNTSYLENNQYYSTFLNNKGVPRDHPWFREKWFQSHLCQANEPESRGAGRGLTVSKGFQKDSDQTFWYLVRESFCEKGASSLHRASGAKHTVYACIPTSFLSF